MISISFFRPFSNTAGFRGSSFRRTVQKLGKQRLCYLHDGGIVDVVVFQGLLAVVVAIAAVVPKFPVRRSTAIRAVRDSVGARLVTYTARQSVVERGGAVVFVTAVAREIHVIMTVAETTRGIKNLKSEVVTTIYNQVDHAKVKARQHEGSVSACPSISICFTQNLTSCSSTFRSSSISALHRRRGSPTSGSSATWSTGNTQATPTWVDMGVKRGTSRIFSSRICGYSMSASNYNNNS